MKNTLEWIDVKKTGHLPEYENLIIILTENNTNYIGERIKNSDLIKLQGGDEAYHIRNVKKWAYVNLKNKEEKASIICDKCQRQIGILEEGIDAKGNFVGNVCTCEECKDNEEIEFLNTKILPADDEGWIWPLKKLPEEGQKIEVKRLSFNRAFKGMFDGEFFIELSYEEGVLDDVIAWRPLKEDKPKETDERKPDFSKLREGDLIIINDCIIGYFINQEEGRIFHAFMKDAVFYDTLKVCIKKIIRIDIDKPEMAYLTATRIGDSVKVTKELSDFKNVFRFEEI